MGLSTYSELIQTVKDYLAQDDVAAHADDFLRLLETRCNREVRVQRMIAQGFDDEPIPVGGVLALPTDFLEIQSHSIDTSVQPVVPEYRPPNEFHGLNAQLDSGVPKLFTIIGNSLHFGPPPDAATHLYTQWYFQEIPALSSGNQTNWLLDFAPDIYLYGTLIEASPFLMDDEKLGTWTTMYDRGLKSLMGQDARHRYRPGARIRTPATGMAETTRQFP